MSAILRRSAVKGFVVAAASMSSGLVKGAPIRDEAAIRNFHLWYYNNMDQTWNNSKWMGIPVWKMPLDLWIYQEMICELKPDVVIEAGTWKGGSALYLAHMMDPLQKGRVITIDIQPQPNLPKHPRITYLSGSSTSPAIVSKVRSMIKPGEKVMAVLDSDHVKPHVLKECDLYGPLVTVGSYLIVEDTNVNRHPVLPNFGPGPMEAVEEFLKSNTNFAVDESREKFGFTFNPGGFLRKIK